MRAVGTPGDLPNVPTGRQMFLFFSTDLMSLRDILNPNYFGMRLFYR